MAGKSRFFRRSECYYSVTSNLHQLVRFANKKQHFQGRESRTVCFGDGKERWSPDMEHEAE